jgi:hypothetical protein
MPGTKPLHAATAPAKPSYCRRGGGRLDDWNDGGPGSKGQSSGRRGPVDRGALPEIPGRFSLQMLCRWWPVRDRG